jgi:hypothetical protein
MRILFVLLLLLSLSLCVSGTLQANVEASINLIVEAFSKTKLSFCFLLACVMQNYSLMLLCQTLVREGSDESPDLLASSKTMKSWHSFNKSFNHQFFGYNFFA